MADVLNEVPQHLLGKQVVAEPAAAPTVCALEDAVVAASAEPLEDDATIVVFAPTAPGQ